jgi:putative MFS transporter
VTTSRAGGNAAASSAFRPFHAWITALAGLAFLGNGMDLSVISFALPGLRAEWQVSPSDVGYVLPMIGIGQLVGSVTIGSLSDRIGRRLAFALTGCLAGLGIGIAALAPNLVFFAACMVVVGAGVGGVAPAASALISEFAPPAYRGRMMAWTQVLWVIGWSISATLGGWFAQQLGWRGMMIVGVPSIALGIVAWLAVPESPRYLMARGRTAEAQQQAAQLLLRHGVVVPLDGPRVSAGRLSMRAQLATIWGPGLWRHTVALWATWMAMNSIFQGPIYWLPVIFQGAGADNPLQYTALVGYAMLPASIVSVMMIDSSGRRPLMIGALGLAAVGALLAAVADAPGLILIGGAALSAGALAAWPVALAWAGELYPTHLRGTAAGWASGASRIGSSSAPLIIGVILDRTGSHTLALLPFAVLLTAAILGVAIFGAESSNQTLEELSAPSP